MTGEFFLQQNAYKIKFVFLPENAGVYSGSRALYRVRKRLLTFHLGKSGNLAPQNTANIAPSPLNGTLAVQITLTRDTSWHRG